MGNGGSSMFYLAAILIVLYLVGVGVYTVYSKIRKRMKEGKDNG